VAVAACPAELPQPPAPNMGAELCLWQHWRRDLLVRDTCLCLDEKCLCQSCHGRQCIVSLLIAQIDEWLLTFQA